MLGPFQRTKKRLTNAWTLGPFQRPKKKLANAWTFPDN